MPDTFQWELTRPTIYPFFFAGFEDPAHIEFTPYSSDELKEIMRSVVTGFRQHKRDTEAVPADITPYARLFDNHFVRIANSTGTPEEQQEFCSAQGGAHGKAQIVAKTLGASERSESGPVSGKFDIFAARSQNISIEQDVTVPDGEDWRVVVAKMQHHYASPTEEQFRRYRSARSSRHISRKKLWTVNENYDVLENCYDSAIRSVTGVTVDGNACTAENKDSWVGHIPLWHKLLVVDIIYGELSEKNG